MIFYGWSGDQMLRMKIQDINEIAAEEVRKAMDTVSRHQPSRFEFRHRKADGTLRDVEVFSSKIKLRDKELLYSIIHDITDRKYAEEALRESEERFRNLHESMIDPFVQTDMKGIIVSFNTSYREMLGYPEEEITGRSYVEFTPDKWHAMEADIVENQILRTATRRSTRRNTSGRTEPCFPWN